MIGKWEWRRKKTSQWNTAAATATTTLERNEEKLMFCGELRIREKNQMMFLTNQTKNKE